MMSFFAGTVFGLICMWLLHARRQPRIAIVEEEKQLLQQEKQIVVEFMHNMVEAVATGGDRQAMFQRIIHAAILSTGAMSACIFEKRPDDTLKGIAVEGLFPPQRKLPDELNSKLATRTQYLENILKSETYRMGEGLIGQVAQSRRAVLIADAQSDPRVVRHKDPALQVRSIIVAPVTFQNELIAVLAVANPADGLAFTDTDFSLVESLAEQVGLAVHNSDAMKLQIEKNKLDLDLELAGNIQGLLLPHEFPPSDKLAFAAHYTAALKIGGDLYDIFALDERHIGVAIADVSGKGISASILMAICQTNLRHYSRHHRSPSKVLAAINRQMSGTMRKDMFITIIYAVFDLETESLTLARAGHEPALFYDNRDGAEVAVQPIRCPGMAVGMVPPELFDNAIEDVRLDFGKKDVLLLYTDGVTETVNPEGDEFSAERLADTLRALGEEGPQDIINGILDGVKRFSGGVGPPDDLTLIAVKHA